MSLWFTCALTNEILKVVYNEIIEQYTARLSFPRFIRNWSAIGFFGFFGLWGLTQVTLRNASHSVRSLTLISWHSLPIRRG